MNMDSKIQIILFSFLLLVTSSSGFEEISRLDTNDITQQGVYDLPMALWEGMGVVGRESKVIHFSFQNLFSLGFIAAILASLGFFGFGAVGRSFETNNLLTPLTWFERNDALFVLTYLLGEEKTETDDEASYQCLNKLACLDDKRAYDILTASSMFMKGAKYLDPLMGTSLSKNQKILEDFHDAIDFRRQGGNCRTKYLCERMPSL